MMPLSRGNQLRSLYVFIPSFCKCRLKDISYVIILCLSCFLFIEYAFPEIQNRYFVWGRTFSSAVNYACNGKFEEVKEGIPELEDFLYLKKPNFDCAFLLPDVKTGKLNAYATEIPYFIGGLGILWSKFGVSWRVLFIVCELCFFVSSVFIFLIFKNFMNLEVSFLFSIIYLLSPSSILSISYYEHYIKVPFFLSAVLVMVTLILRTVKINNYTILATLGGLILGIGSGIRADLWLLAVPMAAVLLFAKTSPHATIARRATAVILFATVGAAASAPGQLVQGDHYFWLQLVEGLATPFSTALGITQASYEWLPQYNDSLGMSWIQAHAFYQIAHGTPLDIDRFTTDGTGAIPGAISWQQFETAGMYAYLKLMAHFPADFTIRPFAAIFRVSSQSLSAQATYAGLLAKGGNFFAQLQPFWSALAGWGRWIIVLLVAELFVLSVRRPREALLLTLLCMFIGGSTAIVFLPRHIWHLYFVAFLVLGVAVQRVIDGIRILYASPPAELLPRLSSTRLHRSLPALARCLALIGGLVGLIFVGRLCQERAVARDVGTLESAERDAIRLKSDEAGNSGVILWNPELVDNFQGRLGDTDSMRYSYYFLARFSRKSCQGIGHVTLAHEASSSYFDDSRSVPLNFQNNSETFDLFFPAYYVKRGADWGYFKGIKMDRNEPGCLMGLYRIRDPAKLPFLITWRLPEHWEREPRYHTFSALP